VTGSSGLIGRWTCDTLVKDGHLVLGIDLLPKPNGVENWDSAICDILDRDALRLVFQKFAPTHVVHLAARIDLEGKTLNDYAANVEGVQNVCDAVASTPSVSRCVYTSSQLVCKVGYIPKHDYDYTPNTVYGESKVKTEETVRGHDCGDTTWCLARPTTVWGPHINAHYRSLFRHIEKGRYFHSGTGPLFKSYSFAGNIAFQYMQLLKADDRNVHEKVFYMADYEPLSLRDYVNRIAKGLNVARPRTYPLWFCKGVAKIGDGLNVVGVNFPFTSFRLRNIRTEYIFDMSRTEAVCGPLPFDFEQGVTDTIEWYRETNSSNGSAS
jgi:nucleoside-diphosphate-sugar epimerase